MDKEPSKMIDRCVANAHPFYQIECAELASYAVGYLEGVWSRFFFGNIPQIDGWEYTGPEFEGVELTDIEWHKAQMFIDGLESMGAFE